MAIRSLKTCVTVVCGLLLALLALTAAARSNLLGEGPLRACYPGNNADLSSSGCPCQSNNECLTTCTSGSFVCGGLTGATVCSAGNTVNASANGCACSNDNECVGNCNQATSTCGGVINAQVCSIGNAIKGSADGCPCNDNTECQGVCVTSTDTCGGVVGQVNNTQPLMSAAALPNLVTLGAQIADSATLSGGLHAGGSVTFRLYPPSAPDCTGTPAFTALALVNGNGPYPSGAFMTAELGRYRWVARYSGDAFNLPVVVSGCDNTTQHVYVGNEFIFRNGFETPPPQ